MSWGGEDPVYSHMAGRFKVQEETAFAISLNKQVEPTRALPCAQHPGGRFTARKVEDCLLVIFSVDLASDSSECSKNKVVFEWQHGSRHFNNNLFTQFCIISLGHDINQPTSHTCARSLLPAMSLKMSYYEKGVSYS